VSGSATHERDVLAARPPRFSTADAEGIARHVFGIEGAASPLDSERDQNFRIEIAEGLGYVLKISNPAEDPAVVDMQTETLRHIARTDPSLPLPRPHPSLDGDYHPRVEDGEGGAYLARLIDFMPGWMFEARSSPSRPCTATARAWRGSGGRCEDSSIPRRGRSSCGTSGTGRCCVRSFPA